MKEHFNEYEEKMLKMMEESERELDEALGGLSEEELAFIENENLDALDAKVFGDIRDFEERVRRREAEKASVKQERGEVGAADTDASDGAKPLGEISGAMSEEDMEALRLGRELQERRRKDEERKAVRKKWAPWKRVAAAVVVIAILGGVGVQSQGGAAKVVEKIMRSHGFKDEEKVISSKEDVINVMSKEEEEAYEQVKEELGIDPVRIAHANKEIKYLSFEVDPELRTAYLLYEYKGQTMPYIINCTYTEDAWGIGFEDEKVDEYEFDGNEINMNVEEYVILESREEEWVATYEYQGVNYTLLGRMEQEEFENILENLFFP
ncbi:MAG: DUF4367 domain-containing protein [Eubacteriales bacterium]|nr:DUF4367 domain-containing protein [Eubacteriales bacterium]